MVHNSHLIKVVVQYRLEVAESTIEFGLIPADSSELIDWQPGAHIDVVIPNIGVRQYSLVGDLQNANLWKIAIQREEDGRGASKYLVDQVQVGDVLEVGLPRNNFPLEASTRYCFIAGGIGITGLLSMIEAVSQTEAEWNLVFLGKAQRNMPYVDSLKRKFSDKVRIHESSNSSRINLEQLFRDLVPGTEIYACGPESLLDSLEVLIDNKAGLSLHLERFSPKTITRELINTEFTVVCKKSQIEVIVQADESIFMALDFAGVELEGDCLEGTCGACSIKVISGDVDHRDSILTKAQLAESNQMMICVSRAFSKELELDV